MPIRASLLILAALAAGPVHAGDFKARIAQAEAAIARPGGYAYDVALLPAVHAVTAACTSPKPAREAAREVFTVVAAVDARGRAQRVQVRPAGPFASCFVRGLARAQLPVPPARSGAHPIVIRVLDRF